MADYYPLLARAVTGLQSSTPEARKAIYDRARGALLGQLRGITPPLPEQDIDRESNALDAAVKRLEDELAVEAARRRRAEKRVDTETELAVDGPTGIDAERRDPNEAAVRKRRVLRDRRTESEAGDGGAEDGNDGNGGDLRTRGDRRRIDAVHPAAPAPQIPRQSKARIWIVGATIVAVVLMIGVTAYFLREDPEDLARTKPGNVVVAPVTGVGKIVGRLGGDGKAAASNPVPSVPVAVVPIVPKPDAPADPTPAPPQPTSAAQGPGQVAPATPGAAPDPVRSAPAIPVTYRAALLVQATGSAEHKTYIGTVVWRLESVTGDPGQPLQTALRADIDIPEAKIKVSVQMQKNTDPALAASHTMVLGFTVGQDSVFKGVRSIQMPQMRDETSPNGEALIGIGIVPITPTYFLVGLQQGEQNLVRNLDLLKSHNWIDVQFVLDDARAAKITFEKGAQGEQYLKEALVTWK